MPDPKARPARLAGAAALLTISSLASAGEQIAKLTAFDGDADDRYGTSIHLDGDRLVVGAWFDDTATPFTGSAYVYAASTTEPGEWELEAKLAPADGGFEHLFGYAVGVNGDVVVVGAYGDDWLGDLFAGSVYVYERDAGGPGVWGETAKLVAGDAMTGQEFGVAVDLDGDRLVVGAFGDDHAGASSGAAYVFERVGEGGAWTQVARLVAPDATAFDHFGLDVAIDGDTIAIGARRADGAALATGAAYVFDRDPSGAWTFSAKLIAADGADSDNFGHAIDVSGDTIVVGAHRDDVALENGGAAHVFERVGGAWGRTAVLAPDDLAAGDQFGYAVSISGSRMAIGSWLHDPLAKSNAGAVYVFVRDDAGAWLQVPKLTAVDGAPGDVLGISVALDGLLVAAGAVGASDPGPNAGAAYTFDVSPPPPPCPADVNGTGTVDVDDLNVVLSAFGDATAGPYESGDVDGDADVDLDDLNAILSAWGLVC